MGPLPDRPSRLNRDGVHVRVPRRPAVTDGNQLLALIHELHTAVATMHHRERAAKTAITGSDSREHEASLRGKACGIRTSRDLITAILARYDP